MRKRETKRKRGHGLKKAAALSEIYAVFVEKGLNMK